MYYVSIIQNLDVKKRRSGENAEPNANQWVQRTDYVGPEHREQSATVNGVYRICNYDAEVYEVYRYYVATGRKEHEYYRIEYTMTVLERQDTRYVKIKETSGVRRTHLDASNIYSFLMGTW